MNTESQHDLFAIAPPANVPADVVDLFESYALTVIASGAKRYSADAVLHRIRWHHFVEQGNRDFKINDHWSSSLARWFLAKHPEHIKFFEIRNRRPEGQC